jgi:hypothetical protein
MSLIGELQIHNNNIKFLISLENEDEPCEVSFRLRDNERWVLVERNQEVLIKPIKRENGFEVNVNLNDLISSFNKISGTRSVIDIHLKNSSKYKKLTITNVVAEYIRGLSLTGLTPLLDVKYYVINNETMGIQLLAKKIKPMIKELRFTSDLVELQLNTTLSNEIINLEASKLVVKQRSVVTTPQTYIDYHSISSDELGTFILKADIFRKFKLDEKEIFELMIEYQLNNYTLQVPLNVGQENILVKRWCNLDRVYILDFVKGKTGNLSVRIAQQKLSINLSAISLDKGHLTLTLKDMPELIKNKTIKFQIRSYLDGLNNKDTSLYYEQVFDQFDNESTSIKINLQPLFKGFTSNYKRKFKLFLIIDNKLYSLYRNDYTETEIIEKTMLKLFSDDTLYIEVSLLETSPIPLAIMGSCFSRAAFNSAEYFNPDYKQYFNVAYSYFWPSIIGLVSDKISYDKEMFVDVSEGNLFEIEWEFLKNWDEALKVSGAKYLLMDFFVDAMHGVLQLKPNQFVARNLITRKTEYYHSTLLKESTSIDSYHPDFFDLWTKSFDVFIEKLKDIIPEENIILNLSLLTDKYYNENGGVSSFFDTKHITKSRYMHVNNIWTKMNNYFLAKLPNAKVIDMNRFQYISRYDSPVDLAPCGPHHFEDGYYKSIINELSKVIGLSSRITINNI